MEQKNVPPPDPRPLDLPHLAEVFIAAALEAGAAILTFWRQGGPALAKADGSPVTEADLAANAVILAALARGCPDIPVVSEEADQPGAARHAANFILVDPLDGTKEFVRGTEEFTVNIALIHDGAPICGVVYAPAIGLIWQGYDAQARKGSLLRGATDPAQISWQNVACRQAPDAAIAVVSRSHLDRATKNWMADQAIGDTAPSGSSIKFCLLAEGVADVYPRFSRTMEWDTAAGDAVLRAAGGRMETTVGAPFTYGKAADLYANPGFIAWGREKPSPPE
jgi:3'(2'), 5'-bisphosphate nucleotidase